MKKILLIIFTFLIVFGLSHSQDIKLIIGINTYHWQDNNLLNNNNLIVGINIQDVTVFHMQNSFYQDSWAVLYTKEKQCGNIGYVIGAATGYGECSVPNKDIQGHIWKWDAIPRWNGITPVVGLTYNWKISDNVEIVTLANITHVTNVLKVNIK